MRVKNNSGIYLEISIIKLGESCWVYRIKNEYPSDPYTSEVKCRKAARLFAKNANLNKDYGWCVD